MHNYCRRCKGTFYGEPDYAVEREDMNGEGAWETRYRSICPLCGGIGTVEERDEDEDVREDEI